MAINSQSQHPLQRWMLPIVAFVVAAAVPFAFGSPATAAASTHVLTPGVVKRSAVVFKLHGLKTNEIRSAKLDIAGRVRSLNRHKVLRSAQTKRLVVTIRRARKLRHRIKLRLTVRESRQSKAAENQRKTSSDHPGPPARHGSEPTNPAPVSEPPPSQPEPEPTPAAPSNPSQLPPQAAQPVTIPADARYVSASEGSDSNSGNAQAPWQTLGKAIASAKAGDVIVIEPGTYGAPGETTNFKNSGVAGSPIVFTSDPDNSPAVIRGYVRITGSYLRLDSLLFDGPTGEIVPRTSENPGGEEVQVSIMYGSHVELTRSEVRDNAWHAGVFVSNATDVSILSNYIHNNGDAATGANLDHGVYWCSGNGIVANNVITDNIAWGVHLYPYAENVLVTRNLITGNEKGGVIVARESSENEIESNTVVENGGYGIRAYNLTGSDNAARDNLLWNNGQDTYGSGMSFSGSLIANPRDLSSAQLASYQP